MDFQPTARVQDLQQQLTDFLSEHIYPAEARFEAELKETRWRTPAVMQELKERARAAGLWNLFLPPAYGDYSPGLSNLEYAPLAELMGRSRMAAEVFNCSAPDTGNMEVLARYGTAAQREQWLQPLLAGDIRSAFAMTEPAVASSDATNIATTITRDGDDYVINGHKFYISGACNEACKLLIVMGKTDPDHEDRHRQQSMILVPMETPGVRVLRPMQVFGYDDAPEGHAELLLDQVRVPAENLILGEGRGFEIAQGRLGPGRIHHCMRLVGLAQRALELMAARSQHRIAFGRPLSQQQSVRETLADAACAIEQARLLTLKAAAEMDRVGNKGAKDLIAMIKIVAPRMACKVIDQAIQIHGGAGLGQDHLLAQSYAYARTIRLADGPDEVHMMQLGRALARHYGAENP
ncbi:MAG: acyl-CoA dehydrogenase family protein [Xanthomonadales bacterium]|nr:acyl-CoA dehydrogenase family protein [Xanthomonadales bacterium]